MTGIYVPFTFSPQRYSKKSTTGEWWFSHKLFLFLYTAYFSSFFEKYTKLNRIIFCVVSVISNNAESLDLSILPSHTQHCIWGKNCHILSRTMSIFLTQLLHNTRNAALSPDFTFGHSENTVV